jgi:hypothetical protein
MKREPRHIPSTVRLTNWDTALTADTQDPASLLIAKEEAAERGGPSASSCSPSGHDLHRVLAYWIGDMNPLRSIAISAALAGLGRPPRPENWLAAAIAQPYKGHALRRRIADQLRLIHQAHRFPPLDPDYRYTTAEALLFWLQGDKKTAAKKKRQQLVLATRGIYLLATRVDPALIAHQSLGTLATLWCVSREALSNQADDLFSGTGIAGAYTQQQRALRARAARGNQSYTRGNS